MNTTDVNAAVWRSLRGWPWARLLAAAGLVVALTAYAVALWRIPDWMHITTGENVQQNRHNARLLVVSVGGAIVVTVGLLYTARNYRLTHRGQVTDRFTKALEQLGSEHADLRLGAIYALRHVARDSRPHRDEVIDVLEAFLRRPTSNAYSPIDSDRATALATVLHRRDDVFRRLILTRAHLAGANLTGADLTDANLTDANLTDANLTSANLSSVDLFEADLTSANLSEANLTRTNLAGTNLPRAHLIGAILTGAHLTGADLTDADLSGADLTSANLTGANLTDAALTAANLTGANLTGTDLTGADLTGADLRQVSGLSAERIQRMARTDSSTQF